MKTWNNKFLTQERLSRLLIGCSILLGVGINCYADPWGYLVLVATAINLVQYAFTGRCLVKNVMDRMGVPYEPVPRHLLVREDGATPARAERTDGGC